MHVIAFFKKNWKINLIILIFTIILILTFVIYYFNITTFNQSSTPSFKGYTELKTRVIEIGKDTEISSQPLYSRFVNKLKVLENPNITDKERYKNLQDSFMLLRVLYSETNNSKLYSFEEYFGNFVKDNFPKLYKKSDFTFFCQDPACAGTSPQPSEILTIVEEIKNSDFPDPVKNSTIKDLLNIGYLPNQDKSDKFGNYAFMANLIKNYGSFSKTNVNEKISNDIFRFLQKTFPTQYEDALKSPQASKSGIIDFNK